MQLTTKHYYDDETFEHVKSKFYIDGEEVDFESYQDFVGGLSEYNKEEVKKINDSPYTYDDDEVCDCCEDCEGCKEDEFDYGELLELFAKRIQETNGNKISIKSILDEFADNFIEDYDEESVDKCDDCENKDICLDISIIEEFYDRIENLDCDCSSCIKNVLYELFMLGKEIGWNDCEKEFVNDTNKNEKESKTNITCNLTVNNTKDDMNKVAEQILNMINNSTRWG